MPSMNGRCLAGRGQRLQRIALFHSVRRRFHRGAHPLPHFVLQML